MIPASPQAPGSPAASPGLGPVSTALEADLRQWVRRHGIVLWLDGDGHYSAFVDHLAALPAGELPYAVRAFRGSYLALLLSLESLASGADKPQLLIHLPGCNEESVRETPLLELYEAGTRYRKALDTLVTEAAAQQVRPEQIRAFTAQTGLSLARADQWLTAVLGAREGGFAAQLRAMKPSAVLEDLISGGPLAARLGLKVAEDESALWEALAAWTGLPEAWRARTRPSGDASPNDIAFCAASWALCVEYVDDLHRPPRSALLTPALHLPAEVIKLCRQLAEALRSHQPRFYQQTADSAEDLLDDEVETAQAEDLGKIDTFRFEEEKVLQAALAALRAERFAVADEWACLRVEGASFWLHQQPNRAAAWKLVQAAARLGLAIGAAGALGAQESLETAVLRYQEVGAAVDQAHRHLEQRRVALLYPQVTEFEALRPLLDGLRSTWRAWADGWARAFSALCQRQGFLPPAALQQRALFDEVVRPLTQEAGGVTAYFLVDALRYEMGEELHRLMQGTPATTLQLKARLAELPTVTEVGMNALAPVAQGGRLRPVMTSGGVQGFSTGEFRVDDPDSRRRAMLGRVGGATCPLLTLAEVLSRDSASLKRTLSQARLLVVHSREIDSAGEREVGPAVFDTAMQQLRAAWQLLREAGVRRFVITADHGFLLLDDGADGAQAHGRKIDPRRRHVFSPLAADHRGEVRVPLADLGYEGTAEQLMMPETTAVFDTGRRPMGFVHGGNSLQERVIPVLTVVHRTAAGGSLQQYRVSASAKDGVGGMHCLELLVEMVAQRTLDFGGPRDIELALRVPEQPLVQVELCEARGPAKIQGAALQATVGQRFELFFRLMGSGDARVQVEVHHPGGALDVQPALPETRFPVLFDNRGAGRLGGSRAPEPSVGAVAAAAPAATAGWLERLPEGPRRLFLHLSVHGAVTEPEAAAILGGPRELRRFSGQLEEHSRVAPFVVRVQVVGGVKRYVREGSGS